MVEFLADPPRFLFFTGKGGVGKTSIACAAAVALAEQGAKVLLVSTDPASNVGQALGVDIGNAITPVAQVPGLDALEIDPEQAAAAYRERIVGPVRGLLPEQEIAAITEQLSGSCTTEVASFNEFTSLLADANVFGQYDHVLFDTAPTGHTIRLLQLPGEWTEFLARGKGDASCLGPLAGLAKQRSDYAAAVAALGDPARTRLVLVTRAQRSALDEVSRTHDELAHAGLRATHLVVNALLPASAGEEDLAVAVRTREAAALAALPAGLAGLRRDEIELRPMNMVGLPALRQLLADKTPAITTPAVDDTPAEDATPADDDTPAAGVDGLPAGRAVPRPLGELVDEIARPGHGLVLCMGKGGVGKTTIAAAVAVALAQRGHQVHLTTTDPAAHLDQTLAGSVAGLRVSRIDPAAATQEYRDRIMATKGKNLDEAGRAALREDLLSPCTEEVAVFGQFSRAIHSAKREFVVVDTAPTGHTLLLLDAAGSYHRDIVRQMGGASGYRTPMMMLADAELTKVLLITLPEPTPVTEARALQEDLQRAGIHPWAWVVNNSMAAAHPTSAFLRRRAAAEAEQLAAVASLADRMAIVPALAEEPQGVPRLSALVETPAMAR